MRGFLSVPSPLRLHWMGASPEKKIPTPVSPGTLFGSLSPSPSSLLEEGMLGTVMVPSAGVHTRVPTPTGFLPLLGITWPKTELSSLAAPSVGLVLKLNLKILILERASSLVYVEEVDFTSGTVSLCPVWKDKAAGPYRKQS